LISAGAPPQTPLGAHCAASEALAVFKGPTTMREEREEGKGKVKEDGGGACDKCGARDRKVASLLLWPVT